MEIMPYILDKNTGQRNYVAPGQMSQTGTGMQSGGEMDFDGIQKILQLQAVSDPKNVSKYAALIDILKPDEGTSLQKNEKSAASEGLSLISGARKSLTGRKTGPKAGIASKVQSLTGYEIPGWFNSDVSIARGDISNINTQLFDIAGKAFTKGEKELLSGLKLDTHDSPEEIQRKLDSWEKILRNKSTGVYGLPGESISGKSSVDSIGRKYGGK
jgi:hypothetical protein